MGKNFFVGQRTQSFSNPMDLSALGSALRDEIDKYKSLPELMNLYDRINGFFDSKFESFWEKQTGSPWKEWHKL